MLIIIDRSADTGLDVYGISPVQQCYASLPPTPAWLQEALDRLPRYDRRVLLMQYNGMFQSRTGSASSNMPNAAVSPHYVENSGMPAEVLWPECMEQQRDTEET